MNQNLSFSKQLIHYLKNNGIEHFFFSIGARNSTLVYSILKSGFPATAHFDERGLAYLALGYIKSSGKKVVIICISGSALANFHPAVLEAYYNGLPLMIISADRPAELIGIGANQAIYQDNFFNPQITTSKTISLEEKIPLAHHFFEISEGLKKLRMGPFHLNVKFREPLFDKLVPIKKNYPHFKELSLEKKIPINTIKRILVEILDAKFPLIVVGKIEAFKELESVKKLLQTLKIPFILDVASNLRNLKKDFPTTRIKNYHHLIKNGSFKKVDLILHLGTSFIGKEIDLLIKQVSVKKYFQVHELEIGFNPSLVEREKINLSINDFSKALLPWLSTSTPLTQNQSKKFIVKKIDPILKLDKKLTSILENYNPPILDELFIAKVIGQQTSKYPNQLFIGNSMCIRDFDLMNSQINYEKILVNRGMSGIDGIIASAGGASLAFPNKKTWLVLGDLSFLHDLNSLSLIKQENLNNLGIFLINNGEGTIFRNLVLNQFFEEKEKKKAFYQHTFNFREVATNFNLEYLKANNKNNFLEQLNKVLDLEKSFILEILVDKEKNYSAHKKLNKKIKKLLV